MKKTFKHICAIALAAVIGITSAPATTNAATKSNVTAKPEYSISNFGLIWDKVAKGETKEVINSFFLTSNKSELYITVRRGGTVYVARCTPSSADNFKIRDFMTLKNCGHGQTLEMYQYNGKTYLLVSANYKKASDGDEWSLEVGRIQYKKDTSIDLGDKSATKRLTNLACANKTGTSQFSLYRADGAVSADGKYLAVWGRGTSKNGTKDQYTYYDFNAINRLWDSNNAVSCTNATVKNSCKFSKVVACNSINPNSSFQGMDITTNGNFYISSSSRASEDHLYYINSSKWSVSDVTVRCIKFSDRNKTSGYGYYNTNDIEIEAPKIFGDKLLFGVIQGKDSSRKAYIYSVAKSIF